MPLYLCRWADRTVTVVQADNHFDATAKLDEVGDATDRQLVELPEFMVSFGLTLDVDAFSFSVEGVGEATMNALVEHGWPVLNEALDQTLHHNLLGFCLLGSIEDDLTEEAFEATRIGATALAEAYELELERPTPRSKLLAAIMSSTPGVV